MSNKKPKLIRVTTVPHSLGGLLRGQCRFMSDYFEVVGISSSSDGHLQKVGEQEGIRVINIEMTRKITPYNDLKALFQLIRCFYREKPLIVHSHTPKAGTLAMIAAFIARVPHRLHTIAGLPLLEATGRKRKLLNWVERITYACAHKIYPNSFGMYDIVLEEKFTSEDKLKVLGKGSSNGIDTSHFDPELFSNEQNLSLRQSLGVDQNDFVFLFIGRLVRDKGIDELVAAFRKLQESIEDIKLVLVGHYERHLDPLAPETEEAINNNPQIVYAGGQADVRPYLAMADLMVFPSYREGFPNVVLESGSMGLPAVVSNINGCNEIIVEGKNGIIVPVKKVEELSEAMQSLYQDKSRLAEMAEQARPMITSRFERKYIWNAILDEYREILDIDL